MVVWIDGASSPLNILHTEQQIAPMVLGLQKLRTSDAVTKKTSKQKRFQNESVPRSPQSAGPKNEGIQFLSGPDAGAERDNPKDNCETYARTHCKKPQSPVAEEFEPTRPPTPQWRAANKHKIFGSYLVDPASSHMLVSKIKPCMSKYKYCTAKLQTAH